MSAPIDNSLKSNRSNCECQTPIPNSRAADIWLIFVEKANKQIHSCLTKASGAVRDEFVVGRAPADVGAFCVDAGTVLARLGRLALVHVRAVEARHHCGKETKIIRVKSSIVCMERKR